MMNVFMLNVVMVSVIIVNVILVSVVMLNVVAPFSSSVILKLLSVTICQQTRFKKHVFEVLIT